MIITAIFIIIATAIITVITVQSISTSHLYISDSQCAIAATALAKKMASAAVAGKKGNGSGTPRGEAEENVDAAAACDGACGCGEVSPHCRLVKLGQAGDDG